MGEAYLPIGDITHAIRYYRKAIVLELHNEDRKETLKKLENSLRK